MTESQASFLKRLSADAGEPFDDTLTKAAASKRIDELLSRGKRSSRGSSVTATPKRRRAPPRPARADGQDAMTDAQAAYLKELADEEGEEFDADLSKDEAARRIGELLVKQMARRSPTEPPF